jgi:hypothetical protein
LPLSEEFRIKEYDEMTALLDDYRKKLEEGNIISLLIMAERTDGQMEGGSSQTQNVFSVCGYALFWAMRRMGFMKEEWENDARKSH